MNLTVFFIATSSSWATPVFTSTHEGDDVLASRAWLAAVVCTGREALAHEQVRIERGTLPGGYLGRAQRDEGGLHTITLDPETTRTDAILVHEVAHAWIHGGPPTLREGRTELLADCMVQAHPGLAPLQWDDSRTLSALPDLLTWSDRSDHGPSMLAHARTDAYLGSARLIRAAAFTLGEAPLLDDPTLDWEAFRELLGTSRRGHEILQILEEGAAAQRDALSDEDLDGAVHLVETWQGTSNHAWDTNQDGWWDGVQSAPEGAVPLPLDQSPVCTGRRAGATPVRVGLNQGGNLRGLDQPQATIVGSRHDEDGLWSLAPHQPLVVRLDGSTQHSGGGVWSMPTGFLLSDTMGCQDDLAQTIWAVESTWDGLLPDVWRISESLREEADHRWGPVPHRLIIVLGSPKTRIDEIGVWLGQDDLIAAVANDSLERLLQKAVAWFRVQALGHGDWRAAEGIANMLDREPSRATSPSR